MSLLVVNSGNRLAQAFIRACYNSQKFEKILCADYHPTYSSIQSYLNFRSTLTQNQTKLVDKKFTDRQDLNDLAHEADHLLYVSHDHYMVVPNKIDLLNSLLDLAPIKGYKKLLFVAPAEYDHAQEKDSTQRWKEVENKQRAKHPNLIGLRSDITFGPDSTIAYNLLQHILYERSLYFKPLGSSPAPISTADLTKIVFRLLTESQENSKSFLAQGPRNIDWQTYVKSLEHATERHVQFNSCQWEKLIPPTSNNLITEWAYPHAYRNLTQLIQTYRGLESSGYENASNLLNGKLEDLEAYYSQNKITKQLISAPSNCAGWSFT